VSTSSPIELASGQVTKADRLTSHSSSHQTPGSDLDHLAAKADSCRAGEIAGHGRRHR
jgi:hypothetical protein